MKKALLALTMLKGLSLICFPLVLFLMKYCKCAFFKEKSHSYNLLAFVQIGLWI